MDAKQYVEELGRNAKAASQQLGSISTNAKNRGLESIAAGLKANVSSILSANEEDVAAAKADNLSPALVDRLMLDESRIEALCQSVGEIVALPDPVGETSGMRLLPNGLQVGKMRIPLGVIAFIYESRPNVTVDGAVLCLKSGNAVILRGGKETIHTNRALARVISDALVSAGLPSAAVQVVNTIDREVVDHLMRLSGTVDLLIPRGGERLINYVNDNAKVPVLKHFKGVCHVYIDEAADLKMGLAIAMNSKTHRPGVCNAAESLLVHQDVAATFLPEFIAAAKEAELELRGCDQTVRIGGENVQAATEADWSEEYLDMIMSVKVVPSSDAAIAHIAEYGSGHTDAIVTENYTTSRKFVREVQSSLVLVNASTRFNDGGQLGMGAEIGISTTKLHAFGPMGLKDLTIEKNIAYGDGQIRS